MKRFNPNHARIVAQKRCPANCERGAIPGGGMCLRCCGAGTVPVWSNEHRINREPPTEPARVLDFARALNPEGGALGDALPFSLTGDVSHQDEPRPLRLTFADED